MDKEDLIGKKFGRLTVVRESERPEYLKNKSSYWICRCDCGNEEFAVISTSLKSGRTKNCGCKIKDGVLEKNTNVSARPNKNENGRSVKEDRESVVIRNSLYNRYRGAARSRKKNFELSFDEFKEIVLSNCHYCGNPPSMKTVYRKTEFVLYNGIDRIDSKLGYTKDNTVPCCEYCNKAKFTMSKEDFRDWVERVYFFYVKK